MATIMLGKDMDMDTSSRTCDSPRLHYAINSSLIKELDWTSGWPR